MFIKPAIPTMPGLAGTHFRTSDETVRNERTGSHPMQKDMESGSTKAPGDPEKVLPSEDEYPDGGLRAWAVVLGVSPCVSLEKSF